jgi:hypothetical protein
MGELRVLATRSVGEPAVRSGMVAENPAKHGLYEGFAAIPHQLMVAKDGGRCKIGIVVVG